MTSKFYSFLMSRTNSSLFHRSPTSVRCRLYTLNTVPRINSFGVGESVYGRVSVWFYAFLANRETALKRTSDYLLKRLLVKWAKRLIVYMRIRLGWSKIVWNGTYAGTTSQWWIVDAAFPLRNLYYPIKNFNWSLFKICRPLQNENT